MSGFEENEVSKNAFGGTEITKRSIAKNIPEELANEFQVIPSRVENIEDDKIRIYWAHDLAEDPICNHLGKDAGRAKFHKLVFSSNWQLNEFNVKLGVPLNDKVEVIETPIEPFKPEEINKSPDEVRLIYFSTPQRGLEILYPVVEKLAEKYPNIHLDVFSSFKIYGWEDADKQFEPLYDKFRNHPNMTYHGFVHQDVLREYVGKAHILAYPNVWKETSCRVLMESMSAGLLCVHPNLAALPDTSGGLTSMYQYHEDRNEHANLFYHYLDHAIEHVNKEDIQRYLQFVKAYADNRFTITKISQQWKNLMDGLLVKYPTVESRKPSQQILVFKT
jgi:glycosyltransferase involved in cell wall biosynthesis